MNDTRPDTDAASAPVDLAAHCGHHVEPDPPGGGTGISAANRWTCTKTDCEAFVIQYGRTIYGPAVEQHCTGQPRRILHTELNAHHPWPATVHVQGGHGWASAQGYHHEWFFEASPAGPPASFLRTTGPSMREAETAAWGAWQAQLACPAAPAHGPFEARGYTNGAGWCTQCGYWFNRVLPPTPDPGADERSRQQLAKLQQATAHLLAARPGTDTTGT